ncbi:hypothetical protein Taro_035813 [Colocasia esculenta]|uniref:Uncharacterized protein n=1 Tax=Colocasia esculenta TaxID=4460 RepID=A0A843W6Q9_COLES|nr:hypothetical protein [Colocasia esculenta]
MFGWPTALSRVCACLSLDGLVVCYKPTVRRGFVMLPRLFARVLELTADRADSRAEGKTVVWGSGAESFVELSCLGQDAKVVEVVLFPTRPRESLVSLPLSALVPEPRSGARRAEAGARLASRLCADCGSPSWLLAAVAWLLLLPVLLVVSARFRGSVLGCQSVVAPTCMASRPGGVSRVRGGSACGPSTLWRCAEGCFRYVPDSIRFCRSRVCVLTLVGGRGIVLFSSAA